MSDAVAQFIDSVEFKVELGTVSSGRPSSVQIRNPEIAFTTSVGHMSPKTERKPRNHLIGITTVMSATTRIIHGAAIH